MQSTQAKPATVEPPPETKPTESIAPTFDDIMGAVLTQSWKDAEKKLRDDLPKVLHEISKTEEMSNYNILLFLDQSNPIGEDHADRLYSSVCKFDTKKDVLLILGSRGGRIEPAYLISENCKAIANARFVVAIPRRAKSAATLLSLGADEIHMGAMSELGPIDPQFGGIPARALSNALQTLARLVSENPKSSDMFAKYLENKLDLGILGYFERINDSATQYASRLLEGKILGTGHNSTSLSEHLVNHYKDHSFVIDKDEATRLFGGKIIKHQTQEYSFSNTVDQKLRQISRFAKWVHKKEITYVGSFDSCLKIKDIQSNEDTPI